MNKVICWLLITVQVQASPILLFGEGTDLNSKNKLVGIDSKGITYSQFYLNTQEEAAKTKVLRAKFIDAKALLLKGDSEAARPFFHEIIALSLDYDWPPADQMLITHAFLSLAEISKSTEEKRFWVKRALTFSLGEIPEVSALSATTQRLINEIWSQEARALNFPVTVLNAWEIILVNGRSLDLNRLAGQKIIPDSYRLTFLSDQLLPHSEVRHSQQFETINFQQKFIVSGSCDNPQLDNAVNKNQKYIAIFSTECQREWSGGWKLKPNSKFLPEYNLISRPEPVAESRYKSRNSIIWGSIFLIGAIVLISSQQTQTAPRTAPPVATVDED